jgi:magnesium transporter
MSIFLSKILNRRLLDSDSAVVGQLTDMLVEPGDSYLRITAVVLKRGGKTWSTPASHLAYQGIGVQLQTPRDQLEFQLVPLDHIQLARDILDAQVIDINGAKVIRVNDVQLDRVDDHWVVAGLDIGAWGLCRRASSRGKR